MSVWAKRFDPETTIESSTGLNERQSVAHSFGDLNLSTIGTTPNYNEVHGFEIANGRMFSLADDAARKRVVVLGAEIPAMFETDAASLIGRDVSIRSIPFTVIGVMEAKGSSGRFNPDDVIWIPLSTAQFRVTGAENVESISVRVAENSSIAGYASSA